MSKHSFVNMKQHTADIRIHDNAYQRSSHQLRFNKE